MKVSFNSIHLKWDKGPSLSLIILRSYLLSRIKTFAPGDTVYNRFCCEDPMDKILSMILSQDADVFAFSCYLWNMELVETLAIRIKEKKPQARVILGGPEVSYKSAKIIEANPWFDILVKGEGEESFVDVMDRLSQGIYDFREISGVTYKHNNKIIDNPWVEFNVQNQDYELYLKDLQHFDEFYYETSRGCPFRCRYCTWQKLGSVRWYQMDKVKRDLGKIFQVEKLKCLKFVDSNFALKKDWALDIFKLLNQMNLQRVKQKLQPIAFHFEIKLENLNDALVDEMAKFPREYWDEYIVGFGIQTMNPYALKVSNRKAYPRKYLENYQKFKERGIKNINLEVIHGLPGDTLEGYKKTLEYLISELNAEYFLSYHYQVLPNSYFWEHSTDYGLVWEDRPPHQLLYSDTFSTKDLKEAKKIVFFFYIFYYGLRRIKKIVDSKFKQNKMRVYEKIIDYIYEKYPQHFIITDDLGALQIVSKEMVSPEKYKLRQEIIKDARNIIERCAQDQQW